MKAGSLIVALVLLAGCGADGPPFRPAADIGVGVGTGGLSATCNVGTTNGTVSVRVGC